MIWQLLVAGALGCCVGVTELGARYRDDPVAALRTLPGLMYVTVNGAAAVAALVIVRAFGWTFGLPRGASELQVQVIQVLVAGIGSAALFRSSLFTVRQGDQEIGIGPSALLTGLLGMVDRGVDRRRALQRLGRDDLAGLSFDSDYVALTELFTGALQNLDKADAQALGELAARLKAESDLSDSEKLDCFGLKLLTLVGPKALQAAAQHLRDRRAAESAKTETLAASAAASTVATPVQASDAQAWRKRLSELEPLVQRPVSASGPLDAALEIGWLHERLGQYVTAMNLYMDLMQARDWPPVLTDHELQARWSRLQILLAKGTTSEQSADRSRRSAHDLLVRLCSRPGGRPGVYAVALYMLVGLNNQDDEALAYLTDAIELLSGDMDRDLQEFTYVLHFARAAVYFGQENAGAAVDDLMLASKSSYDDVRIISGSLGSVLQGHLPSTQALALWRVIAPFGFPLSPGIDDPEVNEIFGIEHYEPQDKDWRQWYKNVAGVLWRHVPQLDYDKPLRTVDLFRSQDTSLPKSFRASTSGADATSKPPAGPSNGSYSPRADGGW
jgi:hypothetical protein